MLKTYCFKCGKKIKVNEKKETAFAFAPMDFPEYNIKKEDMVYFCKKCKKEINHENS